MPLFTFRNVPVSAKIEVEAEDESAARDIVMQNLQGSPDTDFIRSDHWPAGGLVVEYTLGNLPDRVERDD